MGQSTRERDDDGEIDRWGIVAGPTWLNVIQRAKRAVSRKQALHPRFPLQRRPD